MSRLKAYHSFRMVFVCASCGHRESFPVVDGLAQGRAGVNGWMFGKNDGAGKPPVCPDCARTARGRRRR